MAKVTCVFRRTAEGRLALIFAADLLKLLGSASGEVLNIYLDPGQADAERISSEARSVDQLVAAQNGRVLAEVAKLTGLPAKAIAITENDGDCILVDHFHGF